MPSPSQLVTLLKQSVSLDQWPNAEVINAFGIESQAHLEVLFESVKSGDLADNDLERASQNAALLNDLLANLPCNTGVSLPTFTAAD